jgi:hypothetical protein
VTMLASFTDPYVDYVEKYVDWRTGVSCGGFLLLVLLVAVFIARMARSNRSS